MFRNRIRKYAQLWNEQEFNSAENSPTAFVLVPVGALVPFAVCVSPACQALYQMAWELAKKAQAEASDSDSNIIGD